MQDVERLKWSPDIQDDNLGGVHAYSGHVAGVLLIPTQAQQRRVRLRALVDYCAVLFVPVPQ